MDMAPAFAGALAEPQASTRHDLVFEKSGFKRVLKKILLGEIEGLNVSQAMRSPSRRSRASL
jgi:hypothetical protein